MRPLYRFLISAALVVVANFIAATGFWLAGASHPNLGEILYRNGAAALLIGGYLGLSSMLDYVEEGNWAYIGLPLNSDAIRQGSIGFGIGAGMITIAVAIIGIVGDLNFHVHISPRTLSHGAAILVLLIGGAMLEELMFRGYPFQRLVESGGAWGAILFFSVLFGAVHLGNPNAGGIRSWGFANTILVGILFAYAYLRTRTLWLPFGIHLSWNLFLGLVYGLPVSGLRDFSVIVRTEASGSKLLTGGAYGIEASATGAFVIVLGFALVRMVPKPRVKEVLQKSFQGTRLGI